MVSNQAVLEILDDINNIIDMSLNISLENNSEILENKILDYINENYPSIVIPKGKIKELIDIEYNPGTTKFKKSIEFNIADIKYNLNLDNNEEYIKQQFIKLQKIFNTVSMGSNINYLDYIKNTLGSIMKYLMDESKSSITFAKNSIKIRNDVEQLIKDMYSKTMNEYGMNLNRIVDEKIGINLPKK